MPALLLSDFQSYFRQFADRLERHRQKSRLIFFGLSGLAIILIAALPWYAHSLAEALNNAPASISEGEWKEHASASDVFSVAIFVILMSLFMVAWPIFDYRSNNNAAGVLSRGYSLKKYVYSHLLRYFGKFEFSPKGGISATQMGNATIIPRNLQYITEDYIKGVLNESTVKIAQTEIARIVDKRRIAIFNGLLILIDICDPHVKLRGQFHGKTVIIADARKQVPEIRSRYKGYQKLDLNDKDLDLEFEAYTTDPDEAKNLVTREFMETLLGLQKILAGAREHIVHWDDKLAYAAQVLLDHIRVPAHRTAAEKIYDEEHEPALDLTKADPVTMDDQYLNHNIQAEFYDDKILIAIPCVSDLFETSSLFEPTVNNEDCMLLFTIMQSINQITERLQPYFASRAIS